MNEETININGTEYVKKDKKQAKQKDYIITEQCNVLGILPIKHGTEIGREIKIEGFGRTWKLYEGEVKHLMKSENREIEVLQIGNAKYDYNFIERARETAKAFVGDFEPNYYIWDENETYQPLIIKIGDMCFILAPRQEVE
jgi:hypothetical protein